MQNNQELINEVLKDYCETSLNFVDLGQKYKKHPQTIAKWVRTAQMANPKIEKLKKKPARMTNAKVGYFAQQGAQ